MKNFYSKFFSLWLMVGLLAGSLFAQQNSTTDPPIPNPQEPLACASATEYLDFARLHALDLKGTYLIIIARLGIGETSRRLNRHRLSIVDEYYKRNNLTGLKYILAEGSRVKGLGRIELYVGGRLTYVMSLVKNAKGYCFPGEGN